MQPYHSIEALVDGGLLCDAAAAIDQIATPPLQLRLLRELLRCDLENPVTALARLGTLEKSCVAAEDKAVCLEVKARAALVLGEVDRGIQIFELALDCLKRSGDRVAYARCASRFTLSLMNGVGADAALARLPQLRREVTSSGDPQSAIAIHLLQAEIEAKRQRWPLAESHLQLASTLLERYPSARQLAKLTEIAANVAALQSRPREALRLAGIYRDHAKRSGWLHGEATALINLAHFCRITGDFESAQAALRQCRRLLSDNWPIYLALLSSEFELACATGDADRAVAVAAEFDERCRACTPAERHYEAWMAPAYAKWLLSRGETLAAVQRTQRALAIARHAGDIGLEQRAGLIHVEALLYTRPSEATEAYVALLQRLERLPPEILAEAARVAGCLVNKADPFAAEAFFRRAERVFSVSGLSPAASEARSLADAVIRTCGPSQGDHLNALRAIESVAAVLDLASEPRFLGTELTYLIEHCGVANAAAFYEMRAGRSTPLVSFGEVPTTVSRLTKAFTVVPIVASEAEYRLAINFKVDPVSQLAASAIHRLMRAARTVRAFEEALRERAVIWAASTPVDEQVGIVIASESMKELLNLTRRVATSKVTVLFTGETGTGKELLARALHDSSPRRDKPFIPFNCSAVARDMLDSQLFGYKRGAFTGAHEAFPGVIRAAAGGTLFLDEIGEISLDVQPKLLRFLESGEIHPLGEPRPIAVDVRVVAATNANLEQLVREGRFREDLFYRLNVVRLQVPPLRERREEIPVLVQHYLDKCSQESQKSGLRVAEETMEYLVLYRWPGNVRQLANEVRRLVALAESGAVLMPEHLSPDIAASRRTVPPTERDLAPTEFVVRMDQPMSAAIEHLERSMIQYALKQTKGAVEDAAQLLGLSRKGLYLKRGRLKMLDGEAADGEETARALRQA